MTPTLASLFNRAKGELACPGCQNNPRGQFRGMAWDECRECLGEHRNTATIELLGRLVEIEEAAR